MLYIFLLVLIGVVFRAWLTFNTISSGDMGFFYKEHILNYFNVPFMWETFRNLGFGGNAALSQGVYFYNLPLGMLGNYLDFGIIERIIWFLYSYGRRTDYSSPRVYCYSFSFCVIY